MRNKTKTDGKNQKKRWWPLTYELRVNYLDYFKVCEYFHSFPIVAKTKSYLNLKWNHLGPGWKCREQIWTMNQEHRVHCPVPKPIILKCKIFLPQWKAAENLFFDNNGRQITKGKKNRRLFTSILKDLRLWTIEEAWARIDANHCGSFPAHQWPLL